MMLELRNICKTYVQGKLDVPVLKDISLSIDEREYVAIMGPSGSGKTTLMNIIGCLDSPTSGEYFLEGKDIAQNSDSKMSDVRLHSIGFVFQSFYLLSRQSALENVALPLLYAGVRRKERLEIARKALERVGLGDRVHFKPTQLSGGQCQRVAIARAIVNNPKILLADEPTGALDTKSGEQIMEIFQKLNEEGVTIVMITHEREIAAHARRVLHIRDGQLLETMAAPRETGPSLPADVIPPGQFLSGNQEGKTARPKRPAPAPDSPVPPGTPPLLFHQDAPANRRPEQPVSPVWGASHGQEPVRRQPETSTGIRSKGPRHAAGKSASPYRPKERLERDPYGSPASGSVGSSAPRPPVSTDPFGKAPASARTEGRAPSPRRDLRSAPQPPRQPAMAASKKAGLRPGNFGAPIHTDLGEGLFLRRKPPEPSPDTPRPQRALGLST